MRLHYRTSPGAGACSNASEFVQVVAGELGYNPFDAAAPRVLNVAIDRTERELVASATITGGPDAEDAHRLFHTPDRCMTMWERIATHVHLVCAAAPPLVSAPSPLPAPSSREGTAHWLVGAAVSGEVYGALPAFTAGARLYAGRRWPRFSLRIEAHLQLPVTHETRGQNYSTALLGGGVAGCWHPGRFAFCLAARGMWLWVQDRDFFDLRVGAFLGPRVEYEIVRFGGVSVVAAIEALVLAGQGAVFVRREGQIEKLWNVLYVAGITLGASWEGS